MMTMTTADSPTPAAASSSLREPLYVITGVNRLTGEREPITRPHRRDWTEQKLWQTQRCYRYKRRRPYDSLRMEPAAAWSQQHLFGVKSPRTYDRKPL